jgi:hypothetical protein
MGRGRAKAKQQKVARELKYNTHTTDLEALQRELRGSQTPSGGTGSSVADDELEDDEYAGWAGDDWTGTER